MAKITFNKLGLKNPMSIKTIDINNNNIEIKQYLPIDEKMSIVQTLVEECVALNDGYYNPGAVNVSIAVAILKAYTNISFSEKQELDPGKIYDIFVSTGTYQKILEQIPAIELEALTTLVFNSLDKYYEHHNSIAGVFNTIAESPQAIEDLQKVIDSENFSVIKEILGNLG